MTKQLFQILEEKIDQSIETIELLRLEIEEYQEKNAALTAENATLKNKQVNWEQSLASLLRKLEGVNLNNTATKKSDLFGALEASENETEVKREIEAVEA